MSSLNHVMVGVGTPLAQQESVAVVPTSSVTGRGCCTTTGNTAWDKKIILDLRQPAINTCTCTYTIHLLLIIASNRPLHSTCIPVYNTHIFLALPRNYHNIVGNFHGVKFSWVCQK